MAESTLRRLEAEFDTPPHLIRAIVDLLEAGASPQFVAMFRRDECGDPGEDRAVAIHERLRFLSELDRRRENLLLLAEQRAAEGNAAIDLETLRALLADTVDQDLIDDVDHALRPREHRAEARLTELGLAELFARIHRHELGAQSPQDAAAPYVDPARDLTEIDQVLAQVVLALAERYGEDPALRAAVRSELSRGILEARAVATKRGKGGRRAAQKETQSPETTPLETAALETTPIDVPADAEPGSEGGEGEQATGEQATDEQATEDGFADEAHAESPLPSEPESEQVEAGEPVASEVATPEAATSEAATPEPAAEQGDEPDRDSRERPVHKSGGDRFGKLAGLEEPVRKVPAQRMLALRRAEREGFLTLRLKLAPGAELALFRKHFSPDVDPESAFGRFLDLVYGHAWDHYTHRPCEERVRHHLKEKADKEQVRNFARSLRAQLMAPGSGEKPVAALRVAGRSVWLAVVGEDGAPRVKRTLGIPDDPAAQEQLLDELVTALRELPPGFLVIPHGRREGPARDIADRLLAKLPPELARPTIVTLDETSSIVWATSASARRRHGASDTGLRATLSLARRVHDPLFELMRVDVRGLGLGQNLTEVHQGLLRRHLDAAITSCLARIGIDVNRADPALLARAPGIGRELAAAIVKERSAHGPFKSLAELERVPELEPARRDFVACFLRIHGGADPLDATGIPPEDRALAARIADAAGKPLLELLGHGMRGLDIEALCDATNGPLRVRDTIDAIVRGNRDPRGAIAGFTNDGVRSFADLKVDAELRGRITNLTDFGAFVDLGISQDGLIHVSQIPPQRLRDPDDALRVGEVVTVYVLSLDADKHKVGLSLYKPRHMREGRPATLGERLAAGGGRRERRAPAPEKMSRAARAPDGSRGPRRGGPGGGGSGRGGPGGGRDRPRGQPGEGGGAPRGGDRRREGGPPREDREPRSPGGPRVFTIESEKPIETSRGKKGELRSLSSLRSLLREQFEKPPEPPAAPPAP
ncbi:MAG: S1 RNA-binding domain-containing protein [Planctomycetes bacterium]|nr:S1 RNA-binding domain-containing protein [Planctomycetota bacterium]